MEQQQESKVISLTGMYWQIQKWLDEASMSDLHHHIEISAKGYSHNKTGQYKEPTKEPCIALNIQVGGEIVCLMGKSPTVAMEKARIHIESLKIQKENNDTVQDVIVEI